MFEAELKSAWLSVTDVSLPLAEVRDEYLNVKGGEARFMQLADAYSNLNTVEQALFEYMELKPPTFGKKPNREFLMIAEAAIKNGKILMDVAKGELSALKRVAA